MSDRRHAVYCALERFAWSGDDFELAPGVWIKRLPKPPDLNGLERHLAASEWEAVTRARHWLVYDVAEASKLGAAEPAHLMLLSLWTVKATRTQITQRFELLPTSGSGTQIRMLDRFLSIKGHVEVNVSDADLEFARRVYGAYAAMCQARGRLNDALILTLAGCCAYWWQESLICHAAAAEAVLTYSEERGVTRRLAKTFACLTESEPRKMNAAFQEFVSTYKTRSDIIHGRTHKVAEGQRLEELHRFQTLLRRLWSVVCESPSLIADLDGSDSRRWANFEVLEQGYTPPSSGAGLEQ
jgi:hypothetical protein